MANNNNKKSIKIWWLISSFFCVSKKEQKKKFQIFLAFQKKCRKDNDKINFHITQSSAMKYRNTGNQTFPFPWHYVNAHHHHWSFIYLCWIEKINFHNENIFQVKKIDCIHHIKINSSQFNFFFLVEMWMKNSFFLKKKFIEHFPVDVDRDGPWNLYWKQKPIHRRYWTIEFKTFFTSLQQILNQKKKQNFL